MNKGGRENRGGDDWEEAWAGMQDWIIIPVGGRVVSSQPCHTPTGLGDDLSRLKKLANRPQGGGRRRE